MLIERKIVAFYNTLGRRHVELAKAWLPSALAYGTFLGLGIVYFTDWKVIATKIPWYNGKFKSSY